MTLPALNALLNGIATILLTAGFIFIRLDRNNRTAHRNCMVGALVVSAFFLFFYVLDKILKGGVHTAFAGEGLWATLYYLILLTHIPLAMIVLPFIFWTLYLALKGEMERHRRWAKFTFPIWYYVSITGVLIYFFLYVWFTPAATA